MPFTKHNHSSATFHGEATVNRKEKVAYEVAKPGSGCAGDGLPGKIQSERVLSSGHGVGSTQSRSANTPPPPLLRNVDSSTLAHKEMNRRTRVVNDKLIPCRPDFSPEEAVSGGAQNENDGQTENNGRSHHRRSSSSPPHTIPRPISPKILWSSQATSSISSEVSTAAPSAQHICMDAQDTSRTLSPTTKCQPNTSNSIPLSGPIHITPRPHSPLALSEIPRTIHKVEVIHEVYDNADSGLKYLVEYVNTDGPVRQMSTSAKQIVKSSLGVGHGVGKERVLKAKNEAKEKKKQGEKAGDGVGVGVARDEDEKKSNKLTRKRKVIS